MRHVLTAACIAVLWAAGTSAAESTQGKPSTYLGCLRAQDNGTFMLTEVGGPDVPESRSWRSLYMTKTRVLELDAASGLSMREHVGHTMRVTGHRDGKTLRAESMTFVGATCK
ncbi:MAG: hypothetical protein ACRD2A_04530 [Vicinamibacterales bacterium]